MVDKGEVREVDKEANHQSDRAADKGVVEEQQQLNWLGWKYAARLKAYTRFMEKVHTLIIKVKKGHKEMLQKKMKEDDPFGNKEETKQRIPKQMQYGGAEDEAVHMNIRRVQKHDEPDEEEKAQLENI